MALSARPKAPLLAISLSLACGGGARQVQDSEHGSHTQGVDSVSVPDGAGGSDATAEEEAREETEPAQVAGRPVPCDEPHRPMPDCHNGNCPPMPAPRPWPDECTRTPEFETEEAYQNRVDRCCNWSPKR